MLKISTKYTNNSTVFSPTLEDLLFFKVQNITKKQNISVSEALIIYLIKNGLFSEEYLNLVVGTCTKKDLMIYATEYVKTWD